MVLVDTNIVVALLIENTPWFRQAQALFERDPDWRSEIHAMIELTNVLTRYVRIGEFEAEAAVLTLDMAQQRFASSLHLASHADALRTALALRISAYDARFIVIASMLGIRLITEDVKLRRAAPDWTQSIHQALDA